MCDKSVIVIELSDAREKRKARKLTQYSTELPEHDARLFRLMLRGLKVNFETAGCGRLTHFSMEMYSDSKEHMLVEAFLEAL